MDVIFTVKTGQLLGAGLAMGLGAIGAALGEGMTGGYANVSISRRTEMSSPFTRNMLVAQAVAETSAIFALMVAVLLLFSDMSGRGVCAGAAAIGAGIAMGLGAFGSGIGAGYSGGEAILGVSRQPESASQMTTTMLVGQAVCQTPAIFSLVIAFMLMFKDYSGVNAWPYSGCLIGAGIAMGFGAIGSGWGGGQAGGSACRGYARQPKLRGPIVTLMLVGQAVSQTPAIFALLVSIMLMTIGPTEGNLLVTMAFLGAGCSIGLGAVGSGMGNGVTAEAACDALSKESSLSKSIMTFMLVGQAIGQTPVIFAMVVSLLLMFGNYDQAANLPYAMALVSAGLCIGLGAIGSGYGNGITSAEACDALAVRPEKSPAVMTFMLVGQAVGQTPVIFALMVSFMLMLGNYDQAATLPAAMAILAAGLAMGFGAIGPGIGNGITAGGACTAFAMHPEHSSLYMRTMLIAQAVAQSTAIYALVIAFVLMFVV